MSISLENSARLQEIRAQVLSGAPVPIEVLREGLTILRQDRKAASIASASSKASKAPVDTGALLAGLKGLANTLKGPQEG